MQLAGPDDPGTVDLTEVARKTHGYVGADLTQMCTKAAVSCIREKTAESNVDIEAEQLPAEFYDTLKVTMQHMDKAIKQTPASAMKEFVVEIPSVTFDDIGGLEDVKNELREMIEFPVTHPEYFEELGIQPPKGALLYGPPGCGKTLLAKAMANQCECNFISIKGPQLLSKWVGESESNVRNVFEKARQASPCILFFDELDSIARSRGSTSGGPGIGDSVVNQLLTEMDGMAKRNNVFVIGATNKPDGLDPAIMRPGRLNAHIYVGIPDAPARLGILNASLRKAKVSPSVDYNAIVSETDTFSGADLAGLCQGAAKISVRRRKDADLKGEDTTDWSIEPADFEIAFRGARSSVPASDQQRYLDKKEAVGEGGVTSGMDDFRCVYFFFYYYFFSSFPPLINRADLIFWRKFKNHFFFSFSECKGTYMLTEEQAAAFKITMEARRAEIAMRKQLKKDQVAALKAKGSGLRSTSLRKTSSSGGGESKEQKEA